MACKAAYPLALRRPLQDSLTGSVFGASFKDAVTASTTWWLNATVARPLDTASQSAIPARQASSSQYLSLASAPSLASVSPAALPGFSAPLHREPLHHDLMHQMLFAKYELALARLHAFLYDPRRERREEKWKMDNTRRRVATVRPVGFLPPVLAAIRDERQTKLILISLVPSAQDASQVGTHRFDGTLIKARDRITHVLSRYPLQSLQRVLRSGDGGSRRHERLPDAAPVSTGDVSIT